MLVMCSSQVKFEPLSSALPALTVIRSVSLKKSPPATANTQTEPAEIKVEEEREEHLSEDDYPLAYHCKRCSVFLPSAEALAEHKLAKHKRAKRRYACVHCDASYHVAKSLRRHLLDHKRDAETNGDSDKALEYVCIVCGELFSTRKSYREHLVTQHKSGDHECQYCPRTFRLERDLHRHEKTHGAKSYSCDNCDYETTSMPALQLHMEKHTLNQGLPYTCPECEKRFRSATEMQQHYNLHTGDRPFDCKFCGEAFAMKRQLAFHRKRRHPETKTMKEEEYDGSTVCDQCGRKLATRRSLMRHKESHNPTKTYLCDFCGKRMSSSEHLKKHRRIHTGERPYVCPTCQRGFNDTETLKMHIRVHTGEKPFKCDFCPKAFSQKSSWTIHRRKHTGERPYVCPVCKRGFTCRGNLSAHRKTPCV